MRCTLASVSAVFLAVLVSGCGQAQPTMAGGKPVSYWIGELASSDVHVRKKAVQKLGNVGPTDPAVLPALVGAMKDPDSRVRCETILALTKLGPAAKDAVEALLERKLRDRDARVRSYAAKALESIQGKN